MARPALHEVLQHAAAPTTTPPEPEHQAHRAPSRRGRKAVTIYLDTAAHRQLRMLAIEQDSAVQHLAVEAVNDLFQKHGKPRIAD